ncbi:MAG: ZIP family metal transporter [Cyanobacteria bacterium P01_A01_bin.15]
MEQLSHTWSHGVVIDDGVMASLLASFGTGLGAVPVLFTSRLSDRWKTLFLSVGSGVMLAAAAFSLLIPALALVGQSPDYGLGAVVAAAVGGAALFYGLGRLLPEPGLEQQPRSWLFVLAIALHHFPEGLAVGVGTESAHDPSIAVGVALQNLPEGLMVATALRQLGYGAMAALGWATVSGWLEPLGGFVGVTLVGLNTAVAPMGMALAAGAMLYVVWHEVLPDLNLKANSGATAGLVGGVMAMGMVEQLLG